MYIPLIQQLTFQKLPKEYHHDFSFLNKVKRNLVCSCKNDAHEETYNIFGVFMAYFIKLQSAVKYVTGEACFKGIV